MKDIQDLREFNKKESDDIWAQGQLVIRHARMLVACAVALAVVLEVLMGFIIFGAISGPIAEAVSVAGAIAKGD